MIGKTCGSALVLPGATKRYVSKIALVVIKVSRNYPVLLAKRILSAGLLSACIYLCIFEYRKTKLLYPTTSSDIISI